MQIMRLEPSEKVFDRASNPIAVYRINGQRVRIIGESDTVVIYCKLFFGKRPEHNKVFYGEIRFRSKYRIEFEARTKEQAGQLLQSR